MTQWQFPGEGPPTPDPYAPDPADVAAAEALLPAGDLRAAAAAEYPELAPNPQSDALARISRLEQLLIAQQQQLADQEAKNDLLAEQLRVALARPQKLQSPGEFVGREGAPDSPVADHYRLVLANGDVMPTVHPGVSHVAVGQELIPVTRVYHSAAIQRAQHSEAA